jgi:arylsulfatase A-like enzyme
MRSLALALALIGALLAASGSGHRAAHTAAATTYPAGWNLVSGPAGSTLSGAMGSLYTLQPGDTAYETLPVDTPLKGGWGYWAYFPTGGSMQPSADASSYSVVLTPGAWTMIGNPSGSAAATVSGAQSVLGYTPGTGYQATTTLVPGQGAWAIGSGTLTVQVPPGPPSGRPNVLFVLTDDMRIDDLQYMPQVQALIGSQGMTFDDEFDNVTLCCPARTSILRGQYSHNTGVLTNEAGNGGFETAFRENLETATIGTAMHSAGYTTGLFGKYLNGYPNTASPSYIPPGWDTWSSSSKGNPYSEYDYTLNQNGTQVSYGRRPQDYGTDVYMHQASDFISQASQSGKPFFVYLAVYAPHQPATPAPQDVGAFPGLQAPRDPAFNEADVSDKPAYIRELPLLSQRQQLNIDNLYRRRAASLQAVDRGVAGLVAQLQQSDQLDNTYIIFTSDNGFHLGQHRMPSGKQTAYETDIHLPLLVRGPGVAAGAHVSALTGNIDLAPTIAALGGTTLQDNPDGRSLVPFLSGAPSGGVVPAPAGWRQAYLLEHWTDKSTGANRSGASQLEPDDPDQGGAAPGDQPDPSVPPSGPVAPGKIPEFQGLRVANYTYVEYSTGERELYNLSQDPEELNNLASSADPALIAALHARLDALRNCAGDACRSAESQPLNLPG